MAYTETVCNASICDFRHFRFGAKEKSKAKRFRRRAMDRALRTSSTTYYYSIPSRVLYKRSSTEPRTPRSTLTCSPNCPHCTSTTPGKWSPSAMPPNVARRSGVATAVYASGSAQALPHHSPHRSHSPRASSVGGPPRRQAVGRSVRAWLRGAVKARVDRSRSATTAGRAARRRCASVASAGYATCARVLATSAR